MQKTCLEASNTLTNTMKNDWKCIIIWAYCVLNYHTAVCVRVCITPTCIWQPVTAEGGWEVNRGAHCNLSSPLLVLGVCGREVTVCVTCDDETGSISAQFDEPFEPERRQPLRNPNWLPRGRRGRRRRGKESWKSGIKANVSQWKILSIIESR